MNDELISKQALIDEILEDGNGAVLSYPTGMYEDELVEHIEEQMIEYFIKVVNYMPPVEPKRPKTTETMMVDGEPTEIDPLSYEVGYSHGRTERPKGRWIPVKKVYITTEADFPRTHIEWETATEPDDVDAVRCSECGEVFDFEDARNWCTECGADMRSEEK